VPGTTFCAKRAKIVGFFGGAWHPFFNFRESAVHGHTHIGYSVPGKLVPGTKEVLMRKKRKFIEGVYYHVTSRTNNKIRAFESNLGRTIMLYALQDAKDKFNFRLANFCIMPTHIHLLIEPSEGTNLSMIMHWLKTRSAKRWNGMNSSTDHLWGHRYFARAIKDQEEFETVMDYIDQNPVKAELVKTPAAWEESGTFYKANNISGLVDF